jgi:uncharacterized membrane protein HdeD (DUF308 family)
MVDTIILVVVIGIAVFWFGGLIIGISPAFRKQEKKLEKSGWGILILGIILIALGFAIF